MNGDTRKLKDTLSELAERIENGGCDCTFHHHTRTHEGVIR